MAIAKIKRDGTKYVTRDGREVTILMTRRRQAGGQPVVALVKNHEYFHEDSIVTYTPDGFYRPDKAHANLDIMPRDVYDKMVAQDEDIVKMLANVRKGTTIRYGGEMYIVVSHFDEYTLLEATNGATLHASKQLMVEEL